MRALTATAVLLLAGCTRAGGAAPQPQARPLQVEAAAARLLPSGVGAVYLRVVNPGAREDTLLSAETSAASLVELHEVVRDGEVRRMVPRPEGFVVPAGGALQLAPDGRHLMLFGLTAPVDTPRLRLTLRFARGGPLEVQVPVRPLAEDLP